MTDERNITDKPVEIDETVSRAYRELAEENVPERLNRTILGRARKAVRPRYASSRAWTRPLAWAATVVLSVAVVLQMTHVPTPDGSTYDLRVPEPGQDAGATDVRLQTPADVQEKELPTTLPAAEAGNYAPRSPQKGALRQNTAAKSEPVFMEQTNEADEEQAVPAATIAPPAGADEIAGTRYDDSAEPARMQGLALGSSVAACPEDATQDPSTWLECIRELEAAGLSDEASEQRRLLRETFPDFELP